MHLKKEMCLRAAKMWNVLSTEKENFQLLLQNTSLLSSRSTEHKNGQKSEINEHEKLFYFCLNKL